MAITCSLFSLHLPPKLQTSLLPSPKRCCTPAQIASSLSYPNNNNKTLALETHNNANRALVAIQNSGIIACLRAKSAEMALEAARAALSGGITVLEIVVSTPGVYEVLRQLELDYPTAILGDIFEDVSDNQALYIPGVMTPTEILSVYNAGAKIVKVYPVSALGGVQYVAALSKPFSHIPMVASQGIKTDMIGEYIGQGASAVVLSDAIFDMAAMRDRDFTAIHHLACHASLLGSEAVKRSLDDGRQISR